MVADGREKEREGAVAERKVLLLCHGARLGLAWHMMSQPRLFAMFGVGLCQQSSPLARACPRGCCQVDG